MFPIFDILASRIIGERGGIRSVFKLFYYNSVSNAIRCVSEFQQLCILKTTHCGAKGSAIWDSRTLAQYVCGALVPSVSVYRVHCTFT